MKQMGVVFSKLRIAVEQLHTSFNQTHSKFILDSSTPFNSLPAPPALYLHFPPSLVTQGPSPPALATSQRPPPPPPPPPEVTMLLVTGGYSKPAN